MHRLTHAGTGTACRALWVRALVLILLGMTAGLASAQTATPAAPDTPSQVPGQVPIPTITPPAVTGATMRQDTLAEREAFLEKRAISQGMSAPSDVPPLPQQRITAPVSRQP